MHVSLRVSIRDLMGAINTFSYTGGILPVSRKLSVGSLTLLTVQTIVDITYLDTYFFKGRRSLATPTHSHADMKYILLFCFDTLLLHYAKRRQ